MFRSLVSATLLAFTLSSAPALADENPELKKAIAEVVVSVEWEPVAFAQKGGTYPPQQKHMLASEGKPVEGGEVRLLRKRPGRTRAK